MAKTTRAFRTISEAGEELGLQPHVLRFWESKFADINPIKRGGGRRFYRPEDIEFIRGIKVLLHEEKHPIKDVQKLIRVKGSQSVVDLGRSVEKAARERDISEVKLTPERLKTPSFLRPPTAARPAEVEAQDEVASEERVSERAAPVPEPVVDTPQPSSVRSIASSIKSGMNDRDRQDLEAALKRLQALHARWSEFG